MKTRIGITLIAIFALLASFVIPSSAAPQVKVSTAKSASTSYCPSYAWHHFAWQKAAAYARPAYGHVWCVYDPTTGDHIDWQTDGNFVLYDNFNYVLWRSDTARAHGYYLYFSTSGNIDIFTHDKTLLWSNNVYRASHSHATKHFDLGFKYIDEDNNSTSGCPYENYLIEAQGFVYTHSPKLWDYLYPWAIRTLTGQNYGGNSAAQHCDAVTSR